MLSSMSLLASSYDGVFFRFVPVVYARASANTPPTVARAASLIGSGTVTGKSAGLSVLGSDAHGEPSLTYTWKLASVPAGGTASFGINGTNAAKNTTIVFTAAGSYGVVVTIVDSIGLSTSSSLKINVTQSLTSFVLTPGMATVQAGGKQQFQVVAYDQFQKTMTPSGTVAWTTSGGSINSNGLFTAQNDAASDKITAKIGALSGTATVTVNAPAPAPKPAPVPNNGPSFQDAALGKLVASLDADGSLGRGDMIQIITSAGNGGMVSAADFADLKTIVSNASYYNMPDYVRVLASDVVNGNAANATYQSSALGNLAAGSSSAQLNKLVSKWFLGTDHPTLTSTSLTYATAAGSLFPVAPSHNDEYQGQLGDCYLISSLGTIADQNPQAIRNMFIDNGDGTFTVRFYTGSYGGFYNADGSVSDGFAGGKGTADYVTVDRSVVVYANSGGVMAYADYCQNASNASNSLWIPLAEKAYAQWNQTAHEGRDGTNSYNSIQGGWMATVDAQVLGHNASDYNVTNSTKQAMINALATHKAVTIGTDTSSNSDDSLPYGLYGSHAYAVVGYNASADVFTLYNPWGACQPGVLSWSQLEATTGSFVVADPSGSTPIPGGNLHAALAVIGYNAASPAAGTSDRLSPAAVDAVFASQHLAG